MTLQTVKFFSNEIPPASDLSDIGAYSLGNLGVLLEALTSKSDVLLTDVIPILTETGTDVQFANPTVHFGVNKVVGTIAGHTTVVTPPGGDCQIGVYLKLTRTSVVGSRDAIQPVGPNYMRTTVSGAIVGEDIIASVDYTYSASYLVAPPVPTLGPNDVGALLWSTAIVQPNPTPLPNYILSITQNSTALWSFTGSSISVVSHAPTHLPGGGDSIALAVLNGANPNGSDAGLMPDGGQFIDMGSILDLTIHATAAFLTKSISPPSNVSPVTAPRTVTISALLHSSLAIGGSGLEVQFTGSTGSANSSSRSDHIHKNLTTLPFSDVLPTSGTVVTASNLGSQINTIISGISTNTYLYGIKIYWSPPGLSYPKIECGHFIYAEPGQAPQSVGVKYTKESSNTVIRLFTGEKAFTYLDTATLAYVKVATGGAVTWSSSGSSNFPTSGIIYVELLKREITP